MGQVYRVDAECRKEKLGPEERLRRHQAQSGPVMETLRQELQEAVDRKQIEPNSALREPWLKVFGAEVFWPWFTLIGTTVTLVGAWLTRKFLPDPPSAGSTPR